MQHADELERMIAQRVEDARCALDEQYEVLFGNSSTDAVPTQSTTDDAPNVTNLVAPRGRAVVRTRREGVPGGEQAHLAAASGTRPRSHAVQVYGRWLHSLIVAERRPRDVPGHVVPPEPAGTRADAPSDRQEAARIDDASSCTRLQRRSRGLLDHVDPPSGAPRPDHPRGRAWTSHQRSWRSQKRASTALRRPRRWTRRSSNG